MVEFVMSYMHTHALVEKAKAAAEAKEAEEKAEQDRKHTMHMRQLFGPLLYEMLRAVITTEGELEKAKVGLQATRLLLMIDKRNYTDWHTFEKAVNMIKLEDI